MKKKTIIIGTVLIVTIAVFVWGFSFLKGRNFLKPIDKYSVIYSRIGGLVNSSKVTINGFMVGQVYDIRFLSDNSGKLIVDFVLEKEVNIPKNTIARIYSSDLMGTKAIELLLSDSITNHQSGDTLISDIEKDLKEEVNAQMLPLKNKAEELMGTIDSLAVIITSVFGENTRENLEQSFANINTTIGYLESTSYNLDKFVNDEKSKVSHILSNIDTISNIFYENSDSFKKIIENFATLSDSLAKIDFARTLNNVNIAFLQATEMIDEIRRGENNIGKLLNDDELYENLKQASFDLDLLIKDIRLNPKKYMQFSVFDFGKTSVLDDEGNEIKPKKKRKKKNDEQADGDVSFRIQIYSGKKRIEDMAQVFKPLKNIEEFSENGMIKYSAGTYSDFDIALKSCDSIKKIIPDAFIVAYKNGERTTIKSALKTFPL